MSPIILCARHPVRLTFPRIMLRALFSCLGAASAVNAQTVLLTKELVIKPIYINSGSSSSPGTTAILDNPTLLAKISLFQDATQKIFAQASIRVTWEPYTIYYDGDRGTSYFNLDGLSTFSGDNVLEMLDLVGRPESNPTIHGGSASPTTLNLWFTGTQNPGSGLSVQSTNEGRSPVYLNGATVSQTIFAGNYLGAVAHELGHVLGIGATHSTISTNLMYTYGISTTLDNIFPNGAQYGQLDPTQIGLTGTSGIYFNPLIHDNPVANDYYTYSAVPEPQQYAAALSLLVGLLAFRRRLRHKDQPP